MLGESRKILRLNLMSRGVAELDERAEGGFGEVLAVHSHNEIIEPAVEENNIVHVEELWPEKLFKSLGLRE